MFENNAFWTMDYIIAYVVATLLIALSVAIVLVAELTALGQASYEFGKASFDYEWRQHQGDKQTPTLTVDRAAWRHAGRDWITLCAERPKRPAGDRCDAEDVLAPPMALEAE